MVLDLIASGYEGIRDLYSDEDFYTFDDLGEEYKNMTTV